MGSGAEGDSDRLEKPHDQDNKWEEKDILNLCDLKEEGREARGKE